MKKSDLFRQHHFFNLLERYDLTRGPLDLFVHLYFKHNRQLGSKDRAWIAEKIYTYFRWKNLIDHRVAKEHVSTQAQRQALIVMLQEEIVPLLSDDPWLRVGFPKELYEAFNRTHGERTELLCLACNKEAPLMLRANAAKITPEALVLRLSQEGVEACVDQSTPCAVRLKQRCNVFALPCFTEGLFEIQDAGSQMAASLVSIRKGQSLLDFCAGSGGKTLAIAPLLQNTGQIFLHDIRKEALLEAKKRLRRAGVQNAQIISFDETSRLSALQGKIDWVLVDAPCSGTGTLRRNPDMKWKFSKEMLQAVCQEQRQIFDTALQYLKKGGTIVYATCSLLKEENEDQVHFFESAYPDLRGGPLFSSTPEMWSTDGFYAASFVRQRD
jgi:16S rRNA (cytosine967-C5)-methyltransferase